MDTLPPTTTISTSIDPDFRSQGSIDGASPTNTPSTNNWSDEMDVADPLPPTAPFPNPRLSPNPPDIPPPKTVEDFSFSFQNGIPQPIPSNPNPPEPDAPRKRKKTRVTGAVDSQWLQHLSNLDHSNDNPLGWIEAIGAITQILAIGVDIITAIQTDSSIISKERARIENITEQLITAATKLKNSTGCSVSPSRPQSSLESKIDELHRKIDSLANKPTSPGTKTYAKASASGT